MTAGSSRAGRLAVVAALVTLATACDPVVNFYGSFFPAWAVCLITGAVVATALHFVFAASGLEDGFVSLVLVYPALTLLLACLMWLALYRA